MEPYKRPRADEAATLVTQTMRELVLRQQNLESNARPLTKEEKAIFERNGNTGELHVCCDGTAIVKQFMERIRHCDFCDSSPSILYGSNPGDSSWQLCNTTFEGCLIERGSTVERTGRMQKVHILESTRVSACGIIRGSILGEKLSFGNSLKVSPGLETGGRRIRVTCETTLEQAAQLCLDGLRDPDRMKKHDEEVEKLCKDIATIYTMICPGTIIEASPEISEAYIGESCVITSGARVRNSTLLASCKVEQGSDVMDSILQDGCRVSSQAIVIESLMCRGSSVSIQGKLLHSILGPGSGVAEGEMNASLVGPMVGFHHQSMLIATFWPAGRGNVGYGANLGSNHTSRAADQSMWAGEGIFFGLSSCAKFPLNLTEAPYSVVATGVVFGPGRLNMPFSLITTSPDTGRTRIAPGWGFSSNGYFVERSAIKMKARAPNGYATEVLRPEIMWSVFIAWELLTKLSRSDIFETKSIFTSDDLEGLYLIEGFITKEDVVKGISAYASCLELFLLRSAYEHSLSPAALCRFPQFTIIDLPNVASTGLEPSKEVIASTVQAMWARVFGSETSGMQLKSALWEREERFAASIYESKKRDHVRGASVFPTGRYDEAISLEKDPVCQSARKRAATLQA